MGALTGTRSRHTSEWIVNGRPRSRPWVIVVFLAVIAALVVVAYQRLMAFETITYELRSCASAVDAESTWGEIESAGCEPFVDASVSVAVYEGTSRHEPSSVDGARYAFSDFPVNTPAHSVEISGTPALGTVLIADPAGRQVRREMAGSASGTEWTGFVGSRGPTEYWLLLSPGG